MLSVSVPFFSLAGEEPRESPAPNSQVKVNDGEEFDQINPAIAVDGRRIYVVWQDWSRMQWDIRFAFSSDEGLTFSKSIVLNDDQTDQDQIFPDIATDGNGNIYAVWADYRSGKDFDLYLAKSSDFGASFQPNVRVNKISPGSQLNPKVEVNSNRNPMVVWHDNRFTEDRDYGMKWNIFFSWSSDGGETFSKGIRVDTKSSNFSLWPTIATASGNICISWFDKPKNAVSFSKSSAGGLAFSPPVNVSGDACGHDAHPAIAAENEKVYITWMDAHESERGKDPKLVISGYQTVDVFLTCSTDKGETFQQPFRVNEVRKMDQLRPSIDVNSGKLAVAWMDNRIVGNYDIYLKLFNAECENLSRSVKIAGSDELFRESNPAVAVVQDTCFVVWQSPARGNFDIYCRKWSLK